MWSASLRYSFSFAYDGWVWQKGELKGVSCRNCTSLVDLVALEYGRLYLFYAPLSMASIYGESRLVAATRQTHFYRSPFL